MTRHRAVTKALARIVRRKTPKWIVLLKKRHVVLERVDILGPADLVDRQIGPEARTRT